MAKAKKTTAKTIAKTTVKSKPKAAPVKAGSKTTSSKPKSAILAKVSKPLNTDTDSMNKVLPHFVLPSTGGKEFSLSKFKGKKVVFYFYPKDATPGCTIEGHDFSKLKPKFEAAGAVVFGISRDSMKSHEKFKENQKYTVELLADEKEIACKIFDVIKEKNMYGKKVIGIERSTFVIDTESKIIKEWRKVRVEGHAQEVLEYVQGLKG
jgi:peroxiredoxin Q/BCP